MLVKEKLSGISLYSLIPQKSVKPRILIKDEPLLSSPFVIPKNRAANSEFTGRTKELDYLRALYSETITHLRKQNGSAEQFYKPIIAAISGDPGIGKSRLMKEFIKRIKANNADKTNNFLYGRNLSTQQQPNGMFSDIVKFNRSKTGSKVKDENNAAVNNLIKESIFKAAMDANKLDLPLVIAFEDMQWADESSIGAFEHILRSINLYTETKQPRIFFIINYRNKFKPSKTLRTEADYREISLEGFTEKETEAFIVNLTGSRSITAKTREIIRERSDGNPFNIEEWYSLLGESKKLSRIPETIRQLLVEKVTNLLPEERSVLIIACVLGRKFELKILRGIQKRAGKEQATAQVMQSLIDKRFLVNLTGDIYEFRHDILQETIYRQLVTELKQNVHLLAGNAIEELFHNKISDYYYELARHYTAAKNESKSIEYLEKAGDKAKDNYEHERALRYYKSLSTLIDTERYYDILLKIIRIRVFISQYNDAIILLNSNLSRIRKLNNKLLLGKAYSLLGEAYFSIGNYLSAEKFFKKVLFIINEKSDIKTLTYCMINYGRVFLKKGKYYEAMGLFDRALKLSVNSDNLNSLCLNWLGNLYKEKGDLNRAQFYHQQRLDKSYLLGDFEAIAGSLNNIGGICFNKGLYLDAKELFKKSLEIFRKIARPHDISLLLGNIGATYLKLNECKKAEKEFHKLLVLAKSTNNKSNLALAYGAMASANLLSCKLSEAVQNYKKQLEIVKKLKIKSSIALCYGNIAIVYANMGRLKKSENLLLKQLFVYKQLGNHEGMVRTYSNLGDIYSCMCDFRKSNLYLKKSIRIGRHYNINSQLIFALSNLSSTYIKQKKFKLAIYHNNECLNNVMIQGEKEIMFDCELKALLLNFITSNKRYRKLPKNHNNNTSKEIEKIKTKLKDGLNLEQKACCYYYLWIMTNYLKNTLISIESKEYRVKTLDLYNRLYDEKKRFKYFSILTELNNNK